MVAMHKKRRGKSISTSARAEMIGARQSIVHEFRPPGPRAPRGHTCRMSPGRCSLQHAHADTRARFRCEVFLLLKSIFKLEPTTQSAAITPGFAPYPLDKPNPPAAHIPGGCTRLPTPPPHSLPHHYASSSAAAASAAAASASSFNLAVSASLASVILLSSAPHFSVARW